MLGSHEQFYGTIPATLHFKVSLLRINLQASLMQQKSRGHRSGPLPVAALRPGGLRDGN
jgi:hypothetical protein